MKYIAAIERWIRNLAGVHDLGSHKVKSVQDGYAEKQFLHCINDVITGQTDKL